MIAYRHIIESDIPALFEIRIATWGNDRGAEELAELGINPTSVAKQLRTSHAGWIALDNDEPVGFAMANKETGELWVISVLPKNEGQGIGRELMRQAEAWLFSHGWKEIWLTTYPDETVRAVGFYRHLGWEDWKMEDDRYMRKANPGSVIKLEEHVLSGHGYTRIVRLKRGPATIPHHLCLFLDGEHYWRDMNVLPLLERLVDEGKLKPMTFAFVGHVSAADRVVDYTCNEDYAAFINDDVVPWLSKEVSALNTWRSTVVGLSLSGLMASYLTLHEESSFQNCISQSGSYWWKSGWFAEWAKKQGHDYAHFWLSVGDQETETNIDRPHLGLFQKISQIEGVERTATALREIGAEVFVHHFAGGHDLAKWKEELEWALFWQRRNGFLNTDCDLISPVDFGEMRTFFENHDCIVGDHDWGNEWVLQLEASQEPHRHYPMGNLIALLPLLKEAKQRFPEIFAQLKKFDFSVGWDAPESPPAPRRSEEFTLPPHLMRELAELGATYTVTIYPHDPEND